MPGNDPEPTTAVLVIGAPIADGDAPLLCERLRAVACASGAQTIVCDVRALAAEARSVDALARMQLVARRLGCQIRLYRASPELADLLAFLGLSTVVGCGRAACNSSRPPPAMGRPPKRSLIPDLRGWTRARPAVKIGGCQSTDGLARVL